MTARHAKTHPIMAVRLAIALLAASVMCLATAGVAAGLPSEHPFEIAPGSFQVTTSSSQAGAHADLTVAFDFAHDETNANGVTYNDVRTTVVELPAGFIGNNTVVPTCTFAQLIGNKENASRGTVECPPASQIGTISFEGKILTKEFEQITIPVYNMEVTSFGVTAEFGFNVEGTLIQTLDASVRPGDSGITVTSPNIERIGEVRKVIVTTWGVPASHAHDAERGQECYSGFKPVCEGGGHPAGIQARPFLSNPTSCEPHIARVRADSWEEPEPATWPHAETEATPSSECERVPFDPSIETQPTTRSAESSSGLDISLVVPQSWENPIGVATSHLKDTVVKLPVGYTANPSLAEGLGVCTPEQFQRETSSSPLGAGCPEESKIGTVDVETPVLKEKLSGAIYMAQPGNNPFGSLLAMYIVVKSPQRGIVVKLAGHIEADETTGQLTTRFDGNPQVPFSRFTLKLRQGANSPLVSPPACGSYFAEAQMTPWSEPLEPVSMLSAHPLVIEDGIDGGPCPAGGVPPFGPDILAGMLNNSAGSYSPMSIRITRKDGEQEITGFSSILPPGLTANLTGIPFCPDADIQAAKGLNGAQEEAQPSCPQASEIGHSLVGAGVGTVLAYTPGKIYLAGPYHGAPLSIVAITSAKVGPFDLGTVVVREALRIDPRTAIVTIDAKASDPIPHIIKGIVIHVRDIRVYADRPHFVLNPTSCDPMVFGAGVYGGGADPSNPADQTFTTVDNRFQLANCQNLGFKPLLKAHTSGKASRADGASLTVDLTYPKAPEGSQANIKSVHVELPKALPSRLSTLNHACVDSVFNQNPANCPSESRVGFAKAVTPVLPVPLEGPAYFVSHGGQNFPELIVILQGYGVTVYLQGETFISKAGITSSTFKSVPDVPVGSFELTLPAGQYSALAANTDLCAASFTMPTRFDAQNGAQVKQDTPVEVEGCPYTLGIVARRIRKRTLTLKVSVPAAGKLVASGKGVSRAAKSAKGRSTLTLTLKEGHAGRLRTKISLRFTPSGAARKQRGKQAKVLRKSLVVTFG